MDEEKKEDTFDYSLNGRKGINLTGYHLWHLIHSFAAVYNKFQMSVYVNFLVFAFELIQCHDCKLEAQQHLEHLKSNREKYLQDNHSLFRWTYNVHCAITEKCNRTLGTKKVSPDYEKIKKAYFEAMGIKYESGK